MAGSRILPEEKTTQKNLLVPIIGGIVALIVVLYLLLCLWASSRSTIFPNVSVNGIHIGGLTTTEAAQKLNDSLAQAQADTTLTLTYGVNEAVLPTRNLLSYDASTAELALHDVKGGFLASGFNLVSHLLGSSDEITAVCALNAQGEADLRTAIDELNTYVDGAVTPASYQMTDAGLQLTQGVSGYTIDADKTIVAVSDAIQSSAVSATSSGTAAKSTEIPLSTVRSAPEALNISAIHDEIYCTAVNAQMDKETFEITDHIVGLDFDVPTAEAEFATLSDGGSIIVPIIETLPDHTTESFSSMLFRDVMCSYTSKVTGTYDRRGNVENAARLCNNTILLPGDIFSYHEAIRHASSAAGFLTGTGYLNGESVPMVGGGVCQMSSTLYAGLLTTSLEIVERHAHMYAVGYVPDGFDATYYGGSLDFKFSNNTEYPLKVVTSYDNRGYYGYLTVSVIGTQLDENTYEPHSSSYDYTKKDPVYVADETIERNKLVEKQNAYTGRTATVTRDIYDADGKFLETETISTDVFKSRGATYHYHPLDGFALGVPDATPPETTAPETTAPETVTPDGTTAETVAPETSAPETVAPETTAPAEGEAVG